MKHKKNKLRFWEWPWAQSIVFRDDSIPLVHDRTFDFVPFTNCGIVLDKEYFVPSTYDGEQCLRCNELMEQEKVEIENLHRALDKIVVNPRIFSIFRNAEQVLFKAYIEDEDTKAPIPYFLSFAQWRHLLINNQEYKDYLRTHLWGSGPNIFDELFQAIKTSAEHDNEDSTVDERIRWNWDSQLDEYFTKKEFSRLEKERLWFETCRAMYDALCQLDFSQARTLYFSHAPAGTAQNYDLDQAKFFEAFMKKPLRVLTDLYGEDDAIKLHAAGAIQYLGGSPEAKDLLPERLRNDPHIQNVVQMLADYQWALIEGDDDDDDEDNEEHYDENDDKDDNTVQSLKIVEFNEEEFYKHYFPRWWLPKKKKKGK